MSDPAVKPKRRRRRSEVAPPSSAGLPMPLEQLLLLTYAAGWADALDSPRPPIPADVAPMVEQAALDWQSRLIGRRPEPAPPAWLAARIAEVERTS